MKKQWYLGKTKAKLNGKVEKVYLEDFSWDCGWYWAGGYIETKSMHTHFDSCFLNVPDRRGHPLGNFITLWDEKDENAVVLDNGAAIWENINTFLDDVPEHIKANWWRIKDLFVQFYALQKAAEVFQYGGHCTSKNRAKDEIDKKMANKINAHIKNVIVREIRKIMNQEN